MCWVGTAPPSVKRIWDEAEVKRTPAEWALRWIWNRPEVQVNLSGMNDDAHIDENLRIADEALPDSLTDVELDLVRRVAGTYRGLMKSDCTGCRYCLPCPAGVDIPGCLGVLNSRHALKDKRAGLVYMFFNSGAFGGQPSLASQCTECGTCLPRCPQSVPIPDILKEVAADFEGPFFPAKRWLFKRMMTVGRWRAKRGRPDA